MSDGLAALTEREKQALRLLLAGHDAKSAARELGLSVHTVTERLRDARRKLGVTSSREAARRLAGSDAGDPRFSGPMPFGVAVGNVPASKGGRSGWWHGPNHPIAWGLGAMGMMSTMFAALVLFGGVAAPIGSAPPPPAVDLPAAVEGAARDWLALLDAGRWEPARAAAAAAIRTRLSAAQWAAAIEPTRRPLGAVTSRRLDSAMRTTTLPGAPSGDYEMMQFRTGFARKPDAVETVVLSREDGAWKVSGYFIR